MLLPLWRTSADVRAIVDVLVMAVDKYVEKLLAVERGTKGVPPEDQ